MDIVSFYKRLELVILGSETELGQLLFYFFKFLERNF